MTNATGVFPLDQSCTDLRAAQITFVEVTLGSYTYCGIFVGNVQETAMLFSQNGINRNCAEFPFPGWGGGGGRGWVGGYSLTEAI